ncbi:hypothetical protein [Polaromonas hydrogenivorans]|uniref:Holin n=1 Tax=Polaromonas hydrogenivorans TaxID=335476 RepID=A0AAU7LWZ7_9BURK
MTLAAATVAVPTLTALGVPLGLRPDLLIAGFAGSIVAITLLNTVPPSGDTWRELIRTSLRRVAVACASSLTAGYVTPMIAALLTSDPALLGSGFVVGAGAQQALAKLIERFGAAGVAA